MRIEEPTNFAVKVLEETAAKMKAELLQDRIREAAQDTEPEHDSSWDYVLPERFQG